MGAHVTDSPVHSNDASRPALGLGYSGPLGWFLTMFVLVLAGLTGALITIFGPINIAVVMLFLIALALYSYTCLRFPILTLCLILVAQVIFPVYIRLTVPGLPPLPPPLVMLAGLITLTVVKNMLQPSVASLTPYEKLLSTVLLILAVALLVTIPNTHASGVSYSMFVKTIFIPVSLFFVLLAYVRNAEQLNIVYNALIVAAVLSGMLGLYEFYFQSNFVAKQFLSDISIEEDFILWVLANLDEGGGAYFEGGPYYQGEIYRVFSFFTQPLEYSAFMVMVFPIAALKLVSATTTKTKLYYFFTVTVIFTGFIVSFSRGPTLALGIVIVFMAVYEKRVRPWLFAGVLSSFAAIIAFWAVIAEKLSSRILGTDNVSLRFSLWKNGIATFLENPLRGVGFGSYPNYHVTSIREHRIGPMYEYTWPHIERITTVENIYVTLAAETGLIGLSAFSLLLGVYFSIFRKVMKDVSDPLSRTLALASCAGVLGYLLSGMTASNITLYTISILFFGVFVASIAILARSLPVSSPPS